MASTLAARLPQLGLMRRWIASHDQLLLRLAIIGGVLVGSAVLGRRPSVLPLVGLVGIAGLLLFYRWPELGLVLSVIGGLALPVSGPSGLNVTMLGLALLIGLWLVEMLVLQHRFEVVNWPTVRAGLALCMVSVLAFGSGLLPWFPTSQAPLGAQLGGLAIVVLSVGSFAWSSNRIRSLRWLEVITLGFVAFGSLHLIGYLLPPAGRFINTFMFPSGSTGSMYWSWLAVLSFSQALYNRRLGIPGRAALAAVTIATLYVAFVVQNDWKSGWVPALAGVAVVLALSSWRVAVAMLVAALLPAGVVGQQLIMSDAYSYSTRVEAWTVLGEIIKVNPILGLGPANYYWYTPLFSIRGYFVSFNSHNQYVDLVAQFGLVGLLAFVWWMVEIGRIAWRMLRANLADDFARAYVIGSIGGFVAVIVSGFFGDWVLPFFYNVTMHGFRASVLPWVFLGGVVALSSMQLPSRGRKQVQGE